MHISEGILSTPMVAAGFAGTAVLFMLTTRRMEHDEVPKLAVICAAFFVANLIHLPMGAASVHLILNGLAGVILGWRAFPAIMTAVILQAVLLQHGGILTIGVNCVMLGGGALAAYMIWSMRYALRLLDEPRNTFLFGALAGGGAIIISSIIFALAMLFSHEGFWINAGQVLAVHTINMVLEGAVVGSCAAYLYRVKPELLSGYRPPVKGEKLRANA